MKRDKPSLPCPRIKSGQRKFTPKQEAYARQFAQVRIAAMLSTAAVDEAEAERHLRNAYRVGGIKPVPVRWFDSPVPFVIACVEGRVEDYHVWEKLWARAASDLMNRILSEDRERRQGGTYPDWDILKTRIKNNVWWNGIRICIENSIRDRIRNNVWLTTCSGTWESVKDKFGESVWESSPDPYYGYIRPNGFGMHVWRQVMNGTQAYEDEARRSAERFLHEVFEETPLIHLALFYEMVSGFQLGSKEAWLVRKPLLVELDEQGRLHNANGMCMQYRDEWGFYAWHGVCVPAQVILQPEHLTREEWANEQNVEIRRAIQERLGPERFIALVGGTCINRGQRGELLAVDLKDDPERVAHYVHLQDSSTERHYYLRVPPTIQSADEAVAWTFSLSRQEYQPEQET